MRVDDSIISTRRRHHLERSPGIKEHHWERDQRETHRPKTDRCRVAAVD